MTPSHFLCSYTPLCASRAGLAAIQRGGLPPFIDGSCRREPDFQAAFPSISALCRATKFVPRLSAEARVAYITRQSRYCGEPGWGLVALLRVLERFESHEEAAAWYQARGHELPSNCLVAGNPPESFELTHQMVPPAVLAGIDTEAEPERVVRRWDATYAQRARRCGVFLACQAEFLEPCRPPILRRADLLRIFGRVPGTQNPPRIEPSEYGALASFAAQSV